MIVKMKAFSTTPPLLSKIQWLPRLTGPLSKIISPSQSGASGQLLVRAAEDDRRSILSNDTNPLNLMWWQLLTDHLDSIHRCNHSTANIFACFQGRWDEKGRAYSSLHRSACDLGVARHRVPLPSHPSSDYCYYGKVHGVIHFQRPHECTFRETQRWPKFIYFSLNFLNSFLEKLETWAFATSGTVNWQWFPNINVNLRRVLR